jgi:hypothetical protein
MDFPWEPAELYSNFLKWFNILRLTFIAQNTTSILLLVFFFAGGGVVIACWLLVAFGVHFAASGPIPGVITSALKWLVSIYPTLLFMELCELSLWMFKCVDTSSGSVLDMTSELGQKIYCLDTTHTVYLCVAVVFLLLHCAFAVLVVMSDVEMKMNSKNNTERASNVLEIYGVVQRSCVLLAILVLGYHSQQLVALLLLVMSVAKLVIAMVMEPYHRRSVQILVLALAAVETWINISLCIEVHFAWIQFSMNSLLAILGSPVFAIMIVYVWFERNTKLLQLKTKTSSSYELYLKMRKLIQIYDNAEDMENAVWLNGLLSRHVHNCKKKDTCPYHEGFDKILNSTSTTRAEIDKVYSDYINMKYKKIIRADPNNTFLRIAYGLFLSEYVKNRVRALIQLEEAQAMHPSITEQLLLARYKSVFESELAEEKMLVNKMTQSNIELALKFETLCGKFRAALLDSATAFTEVWSYLKNESATSFQLERMVNKIYEQGHMVEDMWEEILLIKGDIPKTLSLYAQYQLKILNDIKTAMGLFKKAKTEEIIQAQAHQENEFTLKDMRNITDYASDGTPCLYISALPVSHSCLEPVGQDR